MFVDATSRSGSVKRHEMPHEVLAQHLGKFVLPIAQQFNERLTEPWIRNDRPERAVQNLAARLREPEAGRHVGPALQVQSFQFQRIGNLVIYLPQSPVDPDRIVSGLGYQY